MGQSHQKRQTVDMNAMARSGVQSSMLLDKILAHLSPSGASSAPSVTPVQPFQLATRAS
jgi:hypothetical protein